MWNPGFTRPVTVWWLLWKSLKHQEDAAVAAVSRYSVRDGWNSRGSHQPVCTVRCAEGQSASDSRWWKAWELCPSVEQRDYRHRDDSRETWCCFRAPVPENTKGGKKSNTHTEFKLSYRYVVSSEVSVSGRSRASARRGAKTVWQLSAALLIWEGGHLSVSSKLGMKAHAGHCECTTPPMHLQVLISSEKATHQLKGDSTDLRWKPWHTQMWEIILAVSPSKEASLPHSLSVCVYVCVGIILTFSWAIRWKLTLQHLVRLGNNIKELINTANCLSLTDEFNWFALQKLGKCKHFSSLKVTRRSKLLMCSKVLPAISTKAQRIWRMSH